jgi:hypothetical protein
MLRGYRYSLYTGLDRSRGLQEFEAARISGQSAHEGGKAVSPKHRPSLPLQGRSPGLISVRG